MKTFKKTIIILTILGMATVNFSPLTLNFKGLKTQEAVAGENEHMKLIGDKRWQSEFMDINEIQMFLDQHPGPLKNYEETINWIHAPGGKTIETSAKDINVASFQLDYFINPRVLMTILELKWQLISDANIQETEITEKISNFFDKNIPEFRATLPNFDQYNNKTFRDQIIEIGYVLNKNYESFSRDKKIIFRDGSAIKASPNINAATFAVQKILARIASNQTEWKNWISDKEGSFADTYQKLFNEDPRSEPSQKSYTPSETVAFLEQKPFHGDFGVWWFFDQDYEKNGQLRRFDNEIISDGESITTMGVGQYGSRHIGIDYDTGISPLYATNSGTIKYSGTWKVSSCPAGTDPNISRIDIEHSSGWRSTYLHLARETIINPETHEEEDKWKVGSVIQKDDSLGTSDAIGCSTDNHLHYMVWDKDALESPLIARKDPFGTWGSTGNISESFWKNPSLLVDNKDVGFQWFERTYAPAANRWTRVDATTDGYAYYSNVKHDSTAKHWDSWAFWTTDIPDDGKYSVSAYIPDIPISGKSVTTKAKYEIYSHGKSTKKEIDQNANKGKWVTLADNLEFKQGAKGAVRLIDETDEASDGKIMWADAIKWFKATPNLHLLSDDTLKIHSQGQAFDGSQYGYHVFATVKNDGEVASESANLCFQPAVGSGTTQCLGSYNLGALAAGESKAVELTFSLTEDLSAYSASTTIGHLKITNAYPAEEQLADNSLSITAGLFVPEPGGIDFTFTELIGASIDPATNQIKFIIKSEEADPGDQIIDLDDARSEITKMFLQALAIPNSKHKISLDVIETSGDYTGRVSITAPFEQTDMADAFLRADREMKFDLFGESALKKVHTLWSNLVAQSPYWADLEAASFHSYPEWVIAATIIPGEATASQTAETIFLEDLSLDMNAGWWMQEPSLDLSGYSFSSQITQDLTQRLAQFKSILEDAAKDYSEVVIVPEINREGSEINEHYKKLRSIYGAIAAAQWYKEQARLNPNLPLAGLVDSENLEGIAREEPFDRAYWDAQAWQLLAQGPCQYFYSMGECVTMGGADLEDSEPDIIGELTATQESIIFETLEEYRMVQEGEIKKEPKEGQRGEAYYSFGNIINANSPDLTFSRAEITAEGYETGEPVVIETKILNNSSGNSGNFVIKVRDSLLDKEGQTHEYAIAERTLSLAGFQESAQNFNWTLPAIEGTHSFYLELDPTDAVDESRENNNLAKRMIEANLPEPQTKIVFPFDGSVIDLHYENLMLSGESYDQKDGFLSGTSLAWASDLDGFLGNGNFLELAGPSLGTHTITLTGTDSDGFSTSDSITIEVKRTYPPAITIIEPDGTDDTADQNFTITWTDEDADDDADVSLYFDTDDQGQDGTLIVEGLSENDETDSYVWDTSLVAEGDYYIYGVINDGSSPIAIDYSDGPVTVQRLDHDGDGYREIDGDCDDADASIHPGAPEICGDGIDQDCSGEDLACLLHDKLTFIRKRQNGQQYLNIYAAPEGVDTEINPLLASDLWIGHADKSSAVKLMATGDIDGEGGGELLFVNEKYNGEQHLNIYGAPAEIRGEINPSIASDSLIGTVGTDDQVTQLSAGDSNGDGTDELILIRERQNGNQYLNVYNIPTSIDGEIDPLIASDIWIGNIGTDNEITHSTAGDIDGDGIDELIFIRKRQNGNQYLNIYDIPTTVGGEINPLLASDAWIGNVGTDNEITHLTAGNTDEDLEDELIFIRQRTNGNQYLNIYDIPTVVEGEINPIIASDLWIGQLGANSQISHLAGILKESLPCPGRSRPEPMDYCPECEVVEDEKDYKL